MSLRPRLSKGLFWTAAAGATASLALDGQAAPILATFAVGTAALSLMVWRGWKPPPQDDAAGPQPLHDASLLEAAAQVARCCANAIDLNDALRGVSRVLASELGARNLLAGWLLSRSGSAGLLEPPRGADDALVGPGALVHQGDALLAQPLLDAARARAPAAATLSPLAQDALREGGVASQAGQGHAFVVYDGVDPVAWLEFEALEIAVSSSALRSLLEVVRAELDGVVQRDRIPRGPPSALSGRTLSSDAEAPEFLVAVAGDRQLSLFVLDPRGMRFLALSRHAEREFSLRANRVLGRTVGEAFPPSLADAASRALEQAVNSGKTVEQELHWASPRGQRGANVSVCALRHADGTARWLIAMARSVRGEHERGGERRAMPRHGLLHADSATIPARELPRPGARPVRRTGQR